MASHSTPSPKPEPNTRQYDYDRQYIVKVLSFVSNPLDSTLENVLNKQPASFLNSFSIQRDAGEVTGVKEMLKVALLLEHCSFLPSSSLLHPSSGPHHCIHHVAWQLDNKRHRRRGLRLFSTLAKEAIRGHMLFTSSTTRVF